MNYYKRHLGDFAKDTAHLSALEIGIYDLLLDRYYSTERPIPDAEANKVARAKTIQDRATVKAVLSEFFKHKDGKWHHNYADRVIEKAREKAAQNRDIGKLGGRPKKTQTVSEINPKETQTVSENNPIPLATNPLIHEEEKTARKRAEVFTPPDWLPLKEWGEFLESRKKHPPTVRAKELLVAELLKLRDQGHDPAQVLLQSTRNSWRDVFPLRSSNAGGQANRKLSLAEESELAVRRFNANG